jgi:hypothetical protein
MLADLDRAAAAVGHLDWGNGGPDNAGACTPSAHPRPPLHTSACDVSLDDIGLRATRTITGTYDSNPENTGFFSDNGGDNYSSPYGRFFLSTSDSPKATLLAPC